MKLEERLENYKKQLEEAKALFFKLQGAVESTQLLIEEKNEPKKDKK